MVVVHDWSYDLLENWRRMDSVAGFFYDCIESMDLVGGVGNLADGTIGFRQRVASVHYSVFQVFLSMLGITGMGIGYSVAEAVVWVWIESFEVLDNWCHYWTMCKHRRMVKEWGC